MINFKKAEEKIPPAEKRKKQKFLRSEIKKDRLNTIIISLTIIMVTVTIFLAHGIIGEVTSELKSEYHTTYASKRDEAYHTQYEKYYNKAKDDYRVGNRVSISIGNLKETASLEVLKASDVEYVIEESNDNSNHITSWLEVPGEGTYVVDLQAAEFVVDNERKYVLVRAPYPEMTNITIDYKNVQKLLFRNDIWNESYKVGEDLARKQLSSADALIRKEFASNQHFYLSAQEAAESTIKCLVKQLNPEVPDLNVEVEFY